MSFRSVFVAVVIAFGLIVAAFLINRARPKVETQQPSEAGSRQWQVRRVPCPPAVFSGP